jgi:MOSC domain-containing protein YiiM
MFKEKYKENSVTIDKSIKSKLIAISISKKKGIPKSNILEANLIENFGIEGDAHASENWHRQISILALESIDKMKEKLPKLTPGIFAENLTTIGINLLQLNIGSQIKIGKEAILEITQIGKECHSKCAIFYKAGDCIMPKEGIFAKVIAGGKIQIDDKIEILG